MSGQDFPDPSIIRTLDGWHIFATNTRTPGKRINVQVGFSSDFKTWTYRNGYDALPRLPAWVNMDSPRVWAPDVNRRPDGTFIFWATSRNVEGPYVDTQKDPWICHASQGGAIDPSGYVDTDGKRYVVYKVDGNSIGHGGECGNTIPPIVPTPIMLQQVSSDGHTKIGGAIRILDRSEQDGPYVEAPSLSKLNGKYVLFYSSNCFVTPKYDVSYALASNIRGPYRKSGQLFVSGSKGMTAPGGGDIAINGDHFVWHAKYGQGRASFTTTVSLNGDRIRASA
ncbi:hypothetical protein LTR37_006657 [Vermiconidia calcicola]|uniref:Uncharacterized protein n=1 Tax=Vermiconidia calcicola TaxID=1690605 RepID=A0ACC3NG79_9PEZI|nr:hypothetical protein LTR37_006657 [Vermiconidia calcicola]